MAYKFTLTEIIHKFVRVGDKYDYVDVEKAYVCNNYDDLQNLFLTLVDFSDGPLKFEITKEEVVE